MSHSHAKMPKTRRSSLEIDNVKKRILEKALDIIIEEGFDKLTMRKLAKRMNMTAANLYNYFINKEELYLYLDNESYKELHGMIVRAISKQPSIEEKIKACFSAYIEFGLRYPFRYDMMFNRFSPKSTDYIGTESEEVAFNQVKEALKIWKLANDLMFRYSQTNPKLKGMDTKFLTLKIWCELHGMISLYNSRILEELRLSEDKFKASPKELIRKFLENILSSLRMGHP
ncbi:MAG: TetR/AcrR family transcriptional regulator [Promethearchaeota archaeon]